MRRPDVRREVAAPLTESLSLAPAAAADLFHFAVAEHHRRLAGLAFVLTGDSNVAEELVAEAYARVWVHFRRHQVDDLGPYLRRAVVNLARSRRRRWRVERRYSERVEQTRPRRAEAGAGRFEDGADSRHTLHAALLALPIEQRAVVVLRHLEDLSEQETATVLNIRPGTVKSRLARGLEALRARLGEPEETP